MVVYSQNRSDAAAAYSMRFPLIGLGIAILLSCVEPALDFKRGILDGSVLLRDFTWSFLFLGPALVATSSALSLLPWLTSLFKGGPVSGIFWYGALIIALPALVAESAGLTDRWAPFRLVSILRASIWIGAVFFIVTALRAMFSSAPGRRWILTASILLIALWGACFYSYRSLRAAPDYPDVAATAAGRPNVVLIVLDTARADHLSCYGYPKETTPAIDAVARQGRRYTNVLSPGIWTLPSHASFFTGLPVSAHGCTWTRPYLDPAHHTLAEMLSEAGYQTAAFSANPILGASRYFDQGFDHYWSKGAETPFIDTLVEQLMGDPLCRLFEEDMREALSRWLRRDYSPTKPFFLFLNYIAPHAPYAPPKSGLQWTDEETWRHWATTDHIALKYRYMLTDPSALSATDIAELESLYDEELVAMDREVGRFLDFMDQNGLTSNTLTIITSDHGEHFGEHGLMGHVYSLNESLARVPLIVRYGENVAPGTEDRLVQSHDLFPTILETAGIDWTPAPEHNSQSLLAPPTTNTVRRLAISEYLAPEPIMLAHFIWTEANHDFTPWFRTLRSAQRGALKFIRWSDGERALFDVGADPMETTNLWPADSITTDSAGQGLERDLDAWLGSFDHYRPTPLAPEIIRPTPPDVVQGMRGLGYAR